MPPTDESGPTESGPGRPVEATPEAGPTGIACPFLVAADGAWRMSTPDRDHRCAAFSPSTSLALGKQARLCLTPGHTSCATYTASMAARGSRVGSEAKLDRTGRWGLARTTPVVLEVGGLRATIAALAADRRTWPAIPAILLAMLAGALGLSSSWNQSTVTAIASSMPTERTASGPTPSPDASAAPTAATSAEPTAGPTASLPEPSATAAVAYTTYRVRSGDTLSGIAARYGTTVSAILHLNGLSGSTLHIGQVLKIPA